MTRIIAAVCAATMALPIAASAQEMSAEAQARLKAAQSAEGSNEQQIYINGKLLNTETGAYTTGPDGEVFIRMDPEYDLTPSEGDDTGMALSPSELSQICRTGSTLEKKGINCEAY
ncbi:hypothetical protein P1J78_03175 [Psychromarinibacter sp. C21-152]|uniref:Uncharacterized protein n=1 Tax=Psychromarinibacter sediminicola TaxID=3033385 RepID=A0AAE3NPH8_9RHOB|nr:hypothetical protein [Psychromarinibacter sediminicola]MDF0599726.1 hypothetical protein [Psychromarinibacter sediminicola]